MKIIAKLEHTPTSPESKMCQVPLCKNKNQEEGLATTTTSFDFKEDKTDFDLDLFCIGLPDCKNFFQLVDDYQFDEIVMVFIH